MMATTTSERVDTPVTVGNGAQAKPYSMTTLFAGFGGQGILFSGKVMAYAGLLEGREVSWLPSYGPEMRGGTANCGVCISSNPVGSPLVTDPDAFVVMNLPSFLKYIDHVRPGGVAVLDSFLIDRKVERNDIRAFYIPATRLASENKIDGLANMIMLGKLLRETQFAAYDSVIAGLRKSVPARKAALVDANIKAIGIGMEYNK